MEFGCLHQSICIHASDQQGSIWLFALRTLRLCICLQPAVLYNIKLADQAISSLHFAPHTIGPPRASPSKPGKASHADRRLTVDAPNDSK